MKRQPPRVVIAYTGDDWSSPYPLTGSPLTTKALEDWCQRAEQHSFQMYRAEISWYDLARACFKKVWGWRQEHWEKINHSVKPTLIFDKTSGQESWPLFNRKLQIARQVKLFNHPLFRAMVANKAQQYLMLGELMPHSWFASSPVELRRALTAIKKTKVVAKPIYGSGGKGIIVDTPSRVSARVNQLEYPVLLQEFITSSVGIPGFSTPPCLADLRIIFSNHRPVCALSRTAKPGSLFTNLHQGATATLVPLNRVPLSTKSVIKNITAKLMFFPEALYTIDILFSNTQKPVLIEINSAPGVDIIYALGDEATRERFFRACIVEHLNLKKS